MADPASVVTERPGSRPGLPKINLPVWNGLVPKAISIEDRNPPLEIERPNIASEIEPFGDKSDPFNELVKQSDAATLSSLDQPEDHDETITVADPNGQPKSLGVVGVQGSGDEIYIPLSRVDDTQDDALEASQRAAPPPAVGTAGPYVLDRPLLPGELVGNPDGSATDSSELIVTERDGSGQFMNAPSLWMTDDGIRQLDWRDAVRTAKSYEARTGLQFPRFETSVAGVNAAKTRSAADGVLSGPLAREPGQEADDVSVLQRFSSAITPRIVHEIGNHLTDAVRGLVVSGPVKGVRNFNKMFITPTIQLDDAVNLPGGKVLTELNSVADIMDYIGAVTGMDATAPVPKTITGGLAEGLGQMLPAMIPLVKGLKAAGHGPAISSLVGGWIADVVTTSTPEAEGIVSMLQMFPDDWQGEWVQAVDEFIHAAPGGTAEAEVRARLVAGLPGLLIGPVVEALLPAAKLVGDLVAKAKDAGLTKELGDAIKAFKADESGSVKLPGGGETKTPPSTPPPTADEIAKARSDTRQGADIVAERLNVIVPESERVIGGTYNAGRPDGRPWSSLTPDELAKRGPGFKGTDADLDRIWQETLGEVSEAARNAVERTGATWNAFPAAEWDKALRLPTRAQLWYELSGEDFVRRLPGLSEQEHMMFLDLIGATSARAQPKENLERALAVLSQRLRGAPVDVDVTIQSTVADALKRGGDDVSSDLANKTGMFSDTLGLVAGKPVRYPISVNDVWVGKAFGIEDSDLSANQALHEVFGKYMNKVRDNVNASGGHAFDHQSWNLQARQWVQMRASEKGIDTSAGKTIEGSDYAGEVEGVVKKLEAAGIKVPGGIMTRDILMDPRFADALRIQTPGFRDAPKATVEFGTLLTKRGLRGAELYQAAREAGDVLTQREYRSILTSSMYASARGKSTLWEKTVRTATGEARSVTRIYSPTADDPYAISGTFEGSASPNIRVPLKNMTPDQIAYFNAMAGKGLKQKAMAAAEVRRLPSVGAPLSEGAVETTSIRFDLDGAVPEKLLTDITEVLGEGFEVSAMRFPDGMSIDINPRFGDAGPVGPDVADVDAAIDMLASRYGARNAKAFASSFKADYGKHYLEDPGDATVYNKVIKDTVKGWKDGAATEIDNLAQGAASKRDIRAFLSGKLDKLPVKKAALHGGVTVSSVRGRASTIRKRLSRRLSDHDEQSKAWDGVGSEVDREMGEAIPKWEARAGRRDN